jgi:hypothetical protein
MDHPVYINIDRIGFLKSKDRALTVVASKTKALSCGVGGISSADRMRRTSLVSAQWPIFSDSAGTRSLSFAHLPVW